MPGEHVQIAEGVFRQFEAIFVANDGDDRVALLLKIMQIEPSCGKRIDILSRMIPKHR